MTTLTDLIEKLERDYYDHEGHAPELPYYTTSRDAAVTLFPPDWFHQIEPRFDIPDRDVVHWWRVYGILPRPDKYEPSGGWFDNVEAKHSNEFIAIVLAALKARAS